MTMTFVRRAPWTLVLFALSGCVVEDGDRDRREHLTLCAEDRIGLEVASDSPALLVTDPAALSGLQLEDVLQHLLDGAHNESITPAQLLQTLFDTANDSGTGVFKDAVHCDTVDNPAHANGPAAFCPRAEGALAKSAGFFTPGHPDHFVPVAAVNRIDLMVPFGASCGQYRIVYAKESGLANPNDRVLLIFEAVLPDPGSEEEGAVMCQDVADFWKGLEQQGPEEISASLRTFFFEGLPGYAPVLTPEHLGVGPGAATYYGTAGQVRVSQHMDEHWELRQLVLAPRDPSSGVGLTFVPFLVGNNPMPWLFSAEASDETFGGYYDFRYNMLVVAPVALAARSVIGMSMFTSFDDLSGESALGGPAVNDYAARAKDNPPLLEDIQTTIDTNGLSAGCPLGDPLTPDSVLRRATMQSCAGCHAPAQFLGPERSIGCGLTWPDSLGQTHIDENGQLSPALKEVFLPHRAEILTKILQACSTEGLIDSVTDNNGTIETKGLDTRRTLGGAVTH